MTTRPATRLRAARIVWLDPPGMSAVCGTSRAFWARGDLRVPILDSASSGRHGARIMPARSAPAWAGLAATTGLGYVCAGGYVSGVGSVASEVLAVDLSAGAATGGSRAVERGRAFARGGR